MANATNSTTRLFSAVREAQDEALRLEDAGEHARARARLLQAVDRIDATPTVEVAPAAGGHRSGWKWGLGASLAAAACALAVVFALPDQQKNLDEIATLEFELDGVELSANTPIIAGEQPQLLAVSDSTRIELAPHSRMVVDDIRSNGAMVVLDHGEVSLAVHHEDDTRWRVAAGPWTVHVTGTQFVVAWEPSTEHFRVAVSEGSVRVEGPEGEVAQLRAGDELVRGEPSIDSGALTNSGVATLEPDTAPPPAIPHELEQAGGDESSPVKPSKASARRWDRHFEDADYQAAWDALTGAPGGIHGEAERVHDARTMLDLADVARFTKHPADTSKLLVRLRARFPNSTEASEAAFTLGRLAADGGSQAKAAVWFERYLDERPNGSLAGDALGRLMDCYDALGQTDDAKSAAQRYLAGHPDGPHAAKAEKILAR